MTMRDDASVRITGQRSIDRVYVVMIGTIHSEDEIPVARIKEPGLRVEFDSDSQTDYPGTIYGKIVDEKAQILLHGDLTPSFRICLRSLQDLIIFCHRNGTLRPEIEEKLTWLSSFPAA